MPCNLIVPPGSLVVPRERDTQFIASTIFEIDATDNGCMGGIDVLAGGKLSLVSGGYLTEYWTVSWRGT